MQDAVIASSQTLMLWLLLLLMVTVLLFGWRCHRAGVLGTFGHHAASGQALLRLAIAASLPAALCSVWLAVEPELSTWAILGTAHLAVAWYGLRWLLPDDLAAPGPASLA